MRFNTDDCKFENKADVERFIETQEAEHGGAWTYTVVLSNVDVYRFKTRSAIPDSFAGEWNGGQKKGRRVRFHGEWMDFTDGQIIREQNLCLSNR